MSNTRETMHVQKFFLPSPPLLHGREKVKLVVWVLTCGVVSHMGEGLHGKTDIWPANVHATAL